MHVASESFLFQLGVKGIAYWRLSDLIDKHVCLDHLEVSRGVPQGSVIGPIMFIFKTDGSVFTLYMFQWFYNIFAFHYYLFENDSLFSFNEIFKDKLN